MTSTVHIRRPGSPDQPWCGQPGRIAKGKQKATCRRCKQVSDSTVCTLCREARPGQSWVFNDGPAHERCAIERANKTLEPAHDCMKHAVPYEGDGPLGHGWECAKCGALIQVG